MLSNTSSTAIIMEITVSDGNTQFAQLLVQPETLLGTLKQMIQAELKIQANTQALYVNNRLLGPDTNDLKTSNIQKGDLIIVKVNQSNMSLSNIPQHIARNPQALMNYIKGAPSLVNELLRVNPQLAEALLQDSLELFTGVLQQQNRARMERKQASMQQIQSLNLDPLDPVAQVLSV